MKLWRLTQAFWINVKRLLYAGNHDFCPGVNQYVYWLKRPIGWLLTAAFASVLVGISIGPQGWVILSVVGSVILLGVAWPAIQMWGCRARLVVQQPRGMEGQSLRVTLEIANSLPFPLWGLMISQRFLSDAKAATKDSEPMAALARVPGWSVTEFHWEHKPTNRGRFPNSGAMLATGFPFGVWQSSRWIQTGDTCLVWPHVPQLIDAFAIQHLRAVGEQAYESRVGEEGDFLGLRAYRDGDSLKKVHWPQSARTGTLVVRESEKAVRQQLTVLVDLSDLLSRLQSSNGGSVAEEIHEAAEQRLRVALATAESLWGSGLSVRVQVGYQVWETSGDRRNIQALMDQLAVWSWSEFFERWRSRRTINFRPDIVVGDWTVWHHDAEMVRLTEPSHGMVLVHPGFDYRLGTLRLIECCSPKAGVLCWQTTEDRE
ncbi:MAG: DUF58 domain-containing protein [Planctomycetaceae bacterium]|nr:DUF58 domain-containing protein [Planctomycetaceae bacterium]